MNEFPVSKRVFIFTPGYQASNGVRVLHRLASLINKYGDGLEAITVTMEPGCHMVKPLIDSEDIVIYPEITIGNPLEGVKVVRYLLNVPGAVGGDGVYGEKDLLVAFNRIHSHLSDGFYLPIPTVEDFFRNENSDRSRDAWFNYKGKYIQAPVGSGFDHLDMTMKFSRRELAAYLNTVNVFYTTDDLSMMNAEAMLCGCKVMLVTGAGEYRDITEQERENLRQFDDWFERFQDFLLMLWSL